MSHTPHTMLALLPLLTLGCAEEDYGEYTHTTDQILGGQTVPVSVLNHGEDSYVRHCLACHGRDGDGMGPAAPGLRPPPRDFRTAMFKFSGAVDGLPHDEDLARIVTDGLHGTAMLPWDVPSEDLASVIQYIKTFSPEGEGWRDPDETLGERMVPTEDPYGEAKKDDAIARGKSVYHGYATCQSCHPAYATKAEIWDYAKEYDKKADYRDNMYLPENKDSDYEVNGVTVKFIPPDFTWDQVRSVHDATSHADIYRIVAGGITGTAMPAWKGLMPETDIWALVYYLDSLIDVRDTPEGKALRDALLSQPEFVPPTEEEEGDTSEGEEDTSTE